MLRTAVAPISSYQTRVFLVIGRRQSPALVAAVLVPAHTEDRVRPAVEKKAFLLGNFHRANPERLRDFIRERPVAIQAYPDGIQVRVLAPVPAMRLRRRIRTAVTRGRLAGVQARGLHGAGDRPPGGIRDHGFDAHLLRGLCAPLVNTVFTSALQRPRR